MGVCGLELVGFWELSKELHWRIDMQLGLIGLGKMGGNMAERLRLGGHQVVGFDFNADAVAKLSASGNVGVSTLEDLAAKLRAARRSGSWCRRASLWTIPSPNLSRC
jgi:UDP-N-acetyl-D-mannosaminuronate dehydrogenase